MTTKASQRIDIFFIPRSDSSVREGWYWIAYNNPKLQYKYEGGPFETQAEAQADLAEYLQK